MSTLMRDDQDPNNPLYYAPPRLRRHPLESRLRPVEDTQSLPVASPPDEERQGLPMHSGIGQTPARRGASSEEQPRRQSRLFEDAVSRALQESLQPETVHSPSLLNHRSGRYAIWGVIARFALAAAAAAVVALFFVMIVPVSRSPVKPGEDAASMASTWQSLKTSLFPAPQRKLASTLVVNDSSGTVNEPLQLGVMVSAPSAGSTVTLRGLPPGARLTAGKRISASEWSVPAREISAAAVVPPVDFAGQITLAAELRGEEGDALVGSEVHLAWTPAMLSAPPARPQQPLSTASLPTVNAPVPVAPTTVAPMGAAPLAGVPPAASPQAAAPSQPTVRNLEPREIASFLSRAQDLISSGDLQSARLLLRRAAEAQNARAAFALAETYDPIVLKRFGASAPAADVTSARSWYEKAREWGAPDAQRQLDALEAFAR
jgi:hypothetical protein